MGQTKIAIPVDHFPAIHEIQTNPSDEPQPVTLLELVEAVSEVSESEQEILATVTYFAELGPRPTFSQFPRYVRFHPLRLSCRFGSRPRDSPGRGDPWHDLGKEALALKITPTDLPDVLLIEPDVHRDTRGFFVETWHAARYAEAGLDARFVQDNHSCSERGTLRGLHLQLEKPQGKLIRVSAGEIFDVAVDIRHGSPTFGRYEGVILSAKNFRQLWIPEGFAHGFCVISEVAEMQYKCTDIYDPTSELTIAWDDPTIGIEWPLENPLLSDKDRAGRSLANCTPQELPVYPQRDCR